MSTVEESAIGMWPLPAMVVLLVLTITAYLVYSGLLASVQVSTKEPIFKDLVIAYKTGTGSYKNAGDLFTDAYLHLPKNRCLGIYYDDPEAVPADELRFAVGSILAEGDQTPDPKDMEMMMKNGYKITTMPKPNFAVTAEFPFRTTISIYLAIFRVYPKLKEYITANSLCAYPAVEIYTSDTIIFQMPLSRQEEWFVSEFSGGEVSIATTEMSTDSRSQGNQANITEGEQNQQQETFAKPQVPTLKVRKPSDNSQIQKSDEDKSDSTVSEFEDLSAELEQKKSEL